MAEAVGGSADIAQRTRIVLVDDLADDQEDEAEPDDARDGQFFARVGAVHPRYGTPYVAIGLSAALGVLFAADVWNLSGREAENGGDFMAEVERQTGIHIRVISGTEEARLIHIAACYGVDVGASTAVVVDIGLHTVLRLDASTPVVITQGFIARDSEALP